MRYSFPAVQMSGWIVWNEDLFQKRKKSRPVDEDKVVQYLVLN